MDFDKLKNFVHNMSCSSFSGGVQTRQKWSYLKLVTVTLHITVMAPMLHANIPCGGCHNESPQISLHKALGIGEQAIGIMDRGQLQNNTSNLGNLSSFHLWFTDSIHWPRYAREDRQYSFGLGLMVGVNDTNVIETVTQSLSEEQDWLPPDDAWGHNYSGDVKTVTDNVPFQASSDMRETWPYGYYGSDGSWISTQERVWPGYHRVDVGHPDFPDTLIEKEGEFATDRDIYCVYNDNYNARGRVGIEVEQTAYSYGRSYAEDFVFWDLMIRNTSGQDLEGIYVGLYAKFRPDYDNHDYINLIDSDGDGSKDLIYVYDLNNERNKTWADTDDPLGIVGLRVYDTPCQLGITDFHHFARGVSPTTDEEMWALLASDPAHPNLLDPDYYFHGGDPRIDYTGWDSLGAFYPPWLDEESQVELEGDAINYIVSCGPFNLPANGAVPLSFGLIMGDAGTVPSQPDTTDLMNNVRMANAMHLLRFQGSGPPAPPFVYALPENQSATLYWSAELSESSIDVLTGKMDFEGYKIFRSTDSGQTWGSVLYDASGNPAGHEPIAIFDLIDGVQGPDPVFPYQSLGNESGLAHAYTDSNLINDLEYWYCVAAYDRGNQHPDSLEPSFMSPLGTSEFEPHTVAVTPGSYYHDGDTLVPVDRLEPIGGPCTGIVRVELVYPDSITGHSYRITFSDNAILHIENEDTVKGLGFTLIDTTESDTLFNNRPFPEGIGDELQAVDGFRLVLEKGPPGVSAIGWTEVAGDTSTFDWRYQSIDPDAGAMLVQEAVVTYDDWRITVDYSGGLEATWCDAFTGAVQAEQQHIPIRVHVITDLVNHPIDVSEHTWQYDFAVTAPWETYRKDCFSPLGWDLIPGGKGYTPGSLGWYEKHVDFLKLVKIDLNPMTGDTIPNYILLFTNNKPDSSHRYGASASEWDVIDAKAPQDGDEFTIITHKTFRPGISYLFSTKKPSVGISSELSGIIPHDFILAQNYPNPFNPNTTLKFELPMAGDVQITIYDLLGREITRLVDGYMEPGYHQVVWDGKTISGRQVPSGIYIARLVSPEYTQSIKMVLLK